MIHEKHTDPYRNYIKKRKKELPYCRYIHTEKDVSAIQQDRVGMGGNCP